MVSQVSSLHRLVCRTTTRQAITIKLEAGLETTRLTITTKTPLLMEELSLVEVTITLAMAVEFSSKTL